MKLFPSKLKLLVYFLTLVLVLQSCTKDENKNTTSTFELYFDDYENAANPSEIFSINSDGTNLQKITNQSNNGTLNIDTEQPNKFGEKLYFVSEANQNSRSRFYLMNKDGSNITAIANNISSPNQFDLIYPFVYSNNSKVVFNKLEYSPNTGYEIWSSNIDGSKPVRLSSFLTDGNCAEPTINPSNSLIIYNKGLDLWKMNLDGTGKVRITNSNTIEYGRANFSSDGSKIVCTGKQTLSGNISSEIYTLNSDGTTIQKLTNYSNNGLIDDALSLYPLFSPNNDKIFYITNLGATAVGQVYSMNLDGSNKTKITSLTFFPSNLTR